MQNLQHSRNLYWFRTAVLAVSLFVGTSAVAQQPAQTRPTQGGGTAPGVSFPNGASSIQETYQDWQVSCVLQGHAKRCVVLQQQTVPQSRQHLITVELQPMADKVVGAAILPFGLVLDRGLTLQIDDKAAGSPVRFHTCLPAGCIIPLSFEGAGLSNLRSGTVLKAKAIADGGRDADFTISLKGLAAAIDRARALAL